MRSELAATRAEPAAARTEIAELRAENAEFKRRLGMNSKSSSKPPSSDGLARPASLRKPSGRGPGKPRGGAGGALMQVAEPDAVEVHSPAVCHGCAGDLASAEVVSIERRQVFDLPEIRLRVTTPHRAPLLRVRADHRRDPVRRPRGPGPVRTAAEEPGRLPAHPSAPALPAVRRTAGRPPGRRGRHRDPAELGRAGRRRGRPAHRGRTPTAHRVRRGRLRRDRHTHRRPHLLGPRRLHPLADAGPGPPSSEACRRSGIVLLLRRVGLRRGQAAGLHRADCHMLAGGRRCPRAPYPRRPAAEPSCL
ncbi:DUF6444 domain-containing protein [Streptomyces sp. NBC_00988]|nr:DUF6444 domain-containing protein [Streptomyces sp. NBC_00988]